MEDLKNVIASAVDKVDKTDNLIKFFQDQNEKARQHELQLFKMLAELQNASQPPTIMQQNQIQGFPPRNLLPNNVQASSFQPMEMPSQAPTTSQGYGRNMPRCNTFEYQESPYEEGW